MSCFDFLLFVLGSIISYYDDKVLMKEDVWVLCSVACPCVAGID